MSYLENTNYTQTTVDTVAKLQHYLPCEKNKTNKSYPRRRHSCIGMTKGTDIDWKLTAEQSKRGDQLAGNSYLKQILDIQMERLLVLSTVDRVNHIPSFEEHRVGFLTEGNLITEYVDNV